MKLSIIIPAYNEENYLPATLDAINAAIILLRLPARPCEWYQKI